MYSVPIATDTNHVALSKYSQIENQHGNVSKVGELIIFELGNFLGSITIIARSKGEISDMSIMWQIKTNVDMSLHSSIILNPS